MREHPLLLIVDDSEDSRELYAEYLRMQGYTVEVAGDGQAAIDEANRLVPDLIVLDLSLPVIDGWEAAKRIKSGDKTRDVPVIALSGYTPSGDGAKSDAFLTKPCSPESLLATIRRLLGQKSS